jgi:hypothetical protein
VKPTSAWAAVNIAAGYDLHSHPPCGLFGCGFSPLQLGIRTFRCPACEEIHQRVIEFADPMKSRTTAGWLRSELRAPT